MQAWLIATAISSYALSALGTLVIFRIHGKEPWAMKGVKILAVLASVASVDALVVASPSDGLQPWHQGIALGLYLLAMVLFLWTAQTNRARPLSIAFSADVPQHLVTTGPYRWVRHPFYTSYLLAYIAAVIGAWQLLLLPVVAIMAGVYTAAARFEERKFASSPLGTPLLHTAGAPACLVRGCGVRRWTHSSVPEV